MFLLAAIRALTVSPVPSCPASCVVCSEDAVLCHGLAQILDAPDTTQALLLTDGSISTVRSAALSYLSNVTVIGLSHNHISVLGEWSFRKLPVLHTLLLDHNHLTSQALQEGALTNLTQLQVLGLGHNLISMIHGGWFKGNTALRSLKLEGNLLTSVDPGTFPLNDLMDLENLDLSENLIDHLDRNSFNGLPSLHTLDLSRNRLSSAPVEAFSYLSWLTNLNMDLNTWNCSCQLLELAAFLSTFLQQPGKTLYNGRRMVCVSADNPAVTTVLELSEANCVPSNQNITVQIEARAGVTPQLYARDLAIAAVVCFIGGVGLTLLVVLIYSRLHKRKKRKESKREEQEGSCTVAHHHVTHMEAGEKKRDLLLQTNSRKPWEREDVTFDLRTDGFEGPFRSSCHFRCPDCSMGAQRGTGPSMMRWTSRMNGGMGLDEERDKRRMKTMAGEERHRFGTQTGNKILSHSNSNSSSPQPKQTLSQRADNVWTDMEGKNSRDEGFHCESCHRTYRGPEQNTRPGRDYRDSALSDGFPSQYRQNDRSNNLDTRRDTRNVTFDLERLGARGQRDSKDKEDDGEETSGDKDRRSTHKAKAQPTRVLRVKLNLNPLRKSKVHPKKTETNCQKKSKDKGNPREDGDQKGRTRKDRKGSNKKEKVKGLMEDCVEEKEEEKKSKKSTKQRNPSPKEGPGKNQSPEDPRTGNTTTDSHPGPSAAIGQGQNLQGGGLVLGGAHPMIALAATNRSQTTNLSLLGQAGLQQTSSSLSLQGGSFIPNTMAPRPAMQVQGALAGPGTAISGLSTAPGGAPHSFVRPAVAGAGPPVTPLQANILHANHAFPLPSSQPAGPAAGLSANLSVNPALVQASLQSHPPRDDPHGAGKLNPDQTAEGLHNPQPQTPQTKESPSVPESRVNLQAPGAAISMENPSHSNSESLHGAAESTAGGLVNEGLGGSGGSLQTSDGSAVCPPGVSDTSPALLQQEYLSEEGGSSPRRRLRLVLPEKTSSRPPTALERKIR